MKIVGIIVEYNPLHNGHIHHIEEIRKNANPDLLIAVMSSTFTMRGDLSLFDKFTKTKQALMATCDLVIELPLLYTIQRADIFALNAVKLLNLANVDEIWIGSEENNIKLYEKYYNLKENNKENINNEIQNGKSYKEANQLLNLDSNDILGYSYYKAIKELNLSIKLNTIKRFNSHYKDDKPTNDYITSALSIRNNLKLIDKYCPSFVLKDKDNILNYNLLFNYLKYKILSTSKDELKEIFFVDEGLENKLYDIAQYNSFDSFIDYLTTKRYTKTRIKRMLIYILLNVKKEYINECYKEDINFIRVLGYNDKGQKYLSEIKKDKLIYTNIKNGLNKVLDLELRVSKLLDFIYNKETFKSEQKGPVKI